MSSGPPWTRTAGGKCAQVVRMTRVALAFTLMATCACTSRTEPQLQQTFDTATIALRRGELTEAQTLAERGLTLMQSAPESEWAWKFRLLRAETLISQLKLSDVAPLFASPLPGNAAFDSLRARRTYLGALVQ